MPRAAVRSAPIDAVSRVRLTSCALAAVTALAACRDQPDFGDADRREVARFGALAFDTAAWRAAGPADRGRMLADLDRRHRLVGARATATEALLGPADCYVHYEDEPCYTVELGGERYALQFGVNHSNDRGRVTWTRLRSYGPTAAPPNDAP